MAASLDAAQPRTRSAAPGRPARLHWRSLSDGILISVLFAGPCLLAAFILRDQREPVWTVVMALAGLGFLAGGAIAGRHRRVARGAVSQGVVCGLLTAMLIVAADLIRQAFLGYRISAQTVELWAGAVVSAMVLGAVGALLGRRLYLRARIKKLSPK